MMNGPHLAPQLVLCRVLSPCLSLSLWLENCLGSGWVMWPWAKGKIKGEGKAKKP